MTPEIMVLICKILVTTVLLFIIWMGVEERIRERFFTPPRREERKVQ